MKTNAEIISDFWEEDRKYKELIQRGIWNQDALDEADWMYQEGVRVSEIERTLEEVWGSKDGGVDQVSDLHN